MNEILVLAEHRKGALREVTFELIGLARQLGQQAGLSVTALLLGHQAGDLALELGAADAVLLMDDDALADCNADCYLPALDAVIRARQPRLTLVPHTAAGMDLAPALAARAGLALATDCLQIALDGGQLSATRQIYGGKLLEQLTLATADQYLATVRPGCHPAAANRAAGDPEPVAPPDWSGRRGRRFLGYVDAAEEDVDISAADVLVSVGRGVGKQENMAAVEAFADAIGATLSCSRPVADKGWLPKSRQVGTSGQVVRPRVYLALGISGAYQHVAGMKNADTIIAVNTDPAAPIFEVAHHGIVADIFEVLPKLQEKLAGR